MLCQKAGQCTEKRTKVLHQKHFMPARPQVVVSKFISSDVVGHRTGFWTSGSELSVSGQEIMYKRASSGRPMHSWPSSGGRCPHSFVNGNWKVNDVTARMHWVVPKGSEKRRYPAAGCPSSSVRPMRPWRQ
jgi:hypothetical protein